MHNIKTHFRRAPISETAGIFEVSDDTISRAGIPQDSKKYYHFYTFVYTTILRALRE